MVLVSRSEPSGKCTHSVARASGGSPEDVGLKSASFGGSSGKALSGNASCRRPFQSNRERLAPITLAAEKQSRNL